MCEGDTGQRAEVGMLPPPTYLLHPHVGRHHLVFLILGHK